MKSVFKFILPIFLFMCISILPGCAGKAVKGVESVTNAGVTTYHNAPVIDDKDKKKYGETTDVVFGKEYDSFYMKLSIDPVTERPTALTVRAGGVGAFPGQQNAADAIVNVQKELKELGVEGTHAASNIITELIKAYIPAPPVGDVVPTPLPTKDITLPAPAPPE